jgi:hypothetical protein
VVNYYLSKGRIFPAASYLFFFMVMPVEQGCFKAAQKLGSKLSKMSDDYDADLPRALKCPIYARLLLKFRHLKEALDELESGIHFLNRTAKEIGSVIYSFKAHTQILLGDFHGAHESLRCAEDILSRIKQMPWFGACYLVAQLTFDLARWEESVTGGHKPASDEYRKRAHGSVKKLMRIVPKVAPERTEGYKLIGTYYWLSRRQKKALKWWARSIAEGEHLHARPELARSYMEVGKRLLGPDSKHRELDGIQAEDCLEKARTLFEEMSLEWDLNELEEIERRL